MSRTALRPTEPRLYTVEDAASLLAMSPERVALHCRQAAGGAPSFFCGVLTGADGRWLIPERVLRRAAGAALQCYTVAEVSILSGLSESAIRARLCMVPGHRSIGSMRQEHQIGARHVTPTDVRIPAAEVDRLLSGQVTGTPEAPTGVDTQKGQPDPFPGASERGKRAAALAVSACLVVFGHLTVIRNVLSVTVCNRAVASVVTVESAGQVSSMGGGGIWGDACGAHLSSIKEGKFSDK